jgi:hypothetical protein
MVLLYFLKNDHYCHARGTLWLSQKCLQYILVKFTPSIILLYLPSPILSSIFIHEYIIFPPYSPSYTLSLYPPPSHYYQPSGRGCFTFLSSVFEKRHFCLFMEMFVMTVPCMYVLLSKLGKEGSKEGEYGWCTFYTRMNIEFFNLLKSVYEGDWHRKETGSYCVAQAGLKLFVIFMP